MSHLKKYQFTNGAANKETIFIAANPQTGDVLFHEEVAKMNDRKAEKLFTRKDGKGKEFVQLVTTGKASSSSAKKEA